jgi:hypothetical protein
MNLDSEILINVDNIFVRTWLDLDGDWYAEAGDTDENPLGTTVIAFGPTKEMALAELAVALWNIIQMQAEKRNDD